MTDVADGKTKEFDFSTRKYFNKILKWTSVQENDLTKFKSRV